MPYEVTIDAKARTIVITGHGRGSTAETLQLIADQQQTFREHAGFHLLYDSSAMEIDSSAIDMVKVAETLFQAPVSFGRIAVVVPQSRELLARIFAALAHPHGVKADVFSHVTDARRWLGRDAD